MLLSFPVLPPPQEATRTPAALTVSRFHVKFLALPQTLERYKNHYEMSLLRLVETYSLTQCKNPRTPARGHPQACM